MGSKVEVFLDNYNGVCYPGQTIAGRVDCYFDKPKNLRAVRIRFKGRAATEWTESHSHYNSTTKKNETRRVRYTARENYFEQEYALVQGGDNFSLSAGRHSYPFSYILPQQLPSSLEGDYGNIRYSIKATVDRPWKFDYEAYMSLNLVSPLDLNYVPRVREPAAISVDKTVGCFCCKSGPITFDFSLPATGYTPGQEVNVGAYVQNMSNVSAERVEFKIVQELEFITHHPSTKRRYIGHELVKCIEGGIGAHGEKSWTSVLKIPVNESFPNLTPCSIINMSYHFKGKLVLPCPHTNLDAILPFMIGNVPLAGLNTSIPGPPPIGQFTSFPPQPGATAPVPDTTPLLLNPTAPYPTGDTISFPNNGPPYPNASGTGPPYLPAAPTSPSQVTPNIPGGAPYPSSGGAPPYPSGGAPPYPSGGVPYPSGGAPYPSGGDTTYPPGSTPYPPAGGSAPYPPGDVPYPSTGKGYPPTSEITSAPPSYDEAKKLKEKDGKPE